MNNKRNDTLSLFLILFITAFFSATGQQTNSTAKDSTLVVQPQFIPALKIIDKIEAEKETIKNIYKEIGENDNLVVIDSLLPIYSKFIKDQKNNTENFIKANPNRLKITILSKKWDGYIERLSIWQEDVNTYAKKNSSLAEKIIFNKKTWELTYENAKEKKIPYEVLNNVKIVLNEVTTLEKNIFSNANDLLKLESKISKQISSSKEVIVHLNELKNSNVYDLFYLRHQPLWKLSFKASKNEKIRKENSESISKNISDFINILKNSEEQVNLFVILVLLISLLILYVRRVLQKSEIYQTGFEITRARDNLKDFTLTTILFTVIVVAKYTFINTPKLFDDFLSIVVLIVIIPLVKANLNPSYYRALYVIVSFYILDLAKTYLWLTTGQYKLYLLVLGLLILVTTFIIKPNRNALKKIKIEYFGTYLQRVTPALYILGTIAIVSNILGYTNLTETIIKSCISVGVITMLFYYILLIVNSISVVMIHRHYNRKIGYDVKDKKKSQRKASKIIRIIMTILGSIIFLKQIDAFNSVLAFSEDVLATPIGDPKFTLGSIISFILILVGSYIATKLVSFAFGDFDESDKLFNVIKLPKGVPAAISLVIRYFIFAFGIMLALSSLGIDLSKFNLMAGALGLGIGFGLQTVVSNFISGLILVFERPILPGDTIEINNLTGVVNRIGVRSSSISTFDGAEVIVPNNNLISSNLINWTHTKSIKRLEINIGATYDADPNKVIQILADAALSSDKVLRTPRPLPLLNEFGESSLNFKLRFWVKTENALGGKSDVSIAIYNKFKENNIDIPFPHQDIYIKETPKDSFPKKQEE
jgi:small-conductance mechanosensitive channel